MFLGRKCYPKKPGTKHQFIYRFQWREMNVEFSQAAAAFLLRFSLAGLHTKGVLGTRHAPLNRALLVLRQDS
jgi:hypothetical protein